VPPIERRIIIRLVIIELEYWFRSNLMEIGLRKWFSVETIFRLYVSRQAQTVLMYVSKALSTSFVVEPPPAKELA
jgi:hypothetical protein